MSLPELKVKPSLQSGQQKEVVAFWKQIKESSTDAIVKNLKTLSETYRLGAWCTLKAAEKYADILTAVKRTPAGVILFGETAQGSLGMDTSGATASAVMGTVYSGGHKPHSQYYNINFLDGHVETLQPKDISGLLEKNYHRIVD